MANLAEVVAHFELIVALLELSGADTRRLQSNGQVLRALRDLKRQLPNAELGELLADGTLAATRGIGPSTLKKARELEERGSTTAADELAAALPSGIVAITHVPGLGAKRIRQLWQELGIESVGELEYACLENRLLTLKGFGPAMQQKALDGIAFLRRSADRFRLPAALDAATIATEWAAGQDAITRSQVAGDVRRSCETCDHVELVAAAEDGAAGAVLDAFCAWDRVHESQSRDDANRRAQVRLTTGVPVALRIVSDDEYPFALLHSTGSPQHLDALREHARTQGLVLTETGLEPAGAGKIKRKQTAKRANSIGDEADVYAAIGLPWIPPELREGFGEVEAAARGELPKLVTEGDLRGVFHVHTVASDGTMTLDEVAKIGRDLAYDYVGVSDHSVSSVIAGGLSIERLREQRQLLDQVNAKGGGGCRLLHGTECDIRADGRLDYPDDVLADLDFVIASIHQGFSSDRARMTVRLVRAASHPATTMLGHLTGRLLLSREGYPVDHEAVLVACAEHGTAIEINAHPYRLDMDWRFLKRAQELGVAIAINPDAHNPRGFDDTSYGVAIARKGWLTKADILNARPFEACTKKRPSAAAPTAEPIDATKEPTTAKPKTKTMKKRADRKDRAKAKPASGAKAKAKRPSKKKTAKATTTTTASKKKTATTAKKTRKSAKAKPQDQAQPEAPARPKRASRKKPRHAASRSLFDERSH